MSGNGSLAILGGKPAFEQPLHVGRPNVGSRKRILERIGEALDRNWLTNGGPLVQEFEQRVADELGVRHCVAMANGTIALEIAIRALGLSGEVILPAFTFVATAHALQWQQITPVFCDVDRATHNINPDQIESLISDRTTAIVGVHLWGRPCAPDCLTEIARRNGLQLLFDAAHAFGCTSNGRKVGGFGACEVFSFHATKFVHSGEGGAVTTNDDLLAAQLRSMRNFGFAGYDNVAAIGTNGKMSELAAAVGLTSLENSSRFIEVNRAHHARYAERLSPIPGLRLIEFDTRERCNYQYVIVEVDANRAGLSRDELVQVLFAENALARRYFHPGCHRMEPYCTLLAANPPTLPVTEDLAGRVMALPTGMQLTGSDVDMICGILACSVESSAEIRLRLRTRRAA